MKTMRNALVLALAVTPVAARAAVTFPGDAAYVPFRCGNAPMSDPVGDDAAFPNERDVVGDAASPAGLRAADATNLYLRLRVNDDPASGNALHAYSWGFAIDLDADRSTYELLLLVDGAAAGGAVVEAFTNHTVTLPNDPTDPADLPAAASVPFAMNGRTIAAGSTLGGNGDFFVDFALPWTTLAPLGLDRTTPVYVWAASSSAANALDGDFACFDNATGAPTLNGTASDSTTAAPGGGSGSGSGGGTGQLQGGEGCAAGGGGGGIAALVIVAFAVTRRRRHAVPSANVRRVRPS